MGLLDTLQPFAQPDPTHTQFPASNLVTGFGPGGAFTYESFNLLGVPMPGQSLLVDCTREFGWQIRKGFGLIGATVVPIGDDPMVFKFKIKIWTSPDAATYRGLLKTILRKPVGLLPGSPISAGMGWDHPVGNDLGVTAVVIKNVSGLLNPLVDSGGKGPWTASCSFYEYRKPLPAVVTPTTTYPGVAPPNPPATNAVEVEIQSQAAQTSALAAQLAARTSGGPVP
jgi:hypothetical protein